MNWTSRIAVVCLAAFIAMAGCSTKKVTRIDPESTTDLSGYWNDTDSRLVAEEMIDDCLSARWLTDFNRDQGKRPTVIAGSIRNKSMEHIAVGTFLHDIERAMINSGQVQVVASAEERSDVRDEREDQRVNASPETLKRMGMEVGADYMLTGDINQINDTDAGQQVKFYQIDMTLIDIETNVKAWVGQKKIKKSVKHSNVGP
jgi:uncharacterized protein (TIGR02722 family)